MSQPFKLYRLQQIDSQLDKIKARLKEIETTLSKDEALQQAQEEARLAGERALAAHKALQRAESDVRQQRVKIEQTEAALYGGKVRNPKELQDLQHEAAALKKFLGVLEERQLEAMLALDESETQQKAAAHKLEQEQARVNQQQSMLRAEEANHLKDFQHLETERQAAAAPLPPEDLKLYDTLRQQRRGIAVAKVTGGACAACGSTLNAALSQTVRSPNQITRCPSCGRILYGG